MPPKITLNCLECGMEFDAPAWAHRKFCSLSCGSTYRHRTTRLPLDEKFWSRVDKSGDCWLWTGATSGGYGFIGYHRTMYRTHRLAYELANGPISAGMDVLHHCDTPLCCRPDHLFLGTQVDNNADKVAKGREHSILCVDDVRAIRERAAAGESRSSLGREYGVCRSTIGAIVTRRNWKHVA